MKNRSIDYVIEKMKMKERNGINCDMEKEQLITDSLLSEVSDEDIEMEQKRIEQKCSEYKKVSPFPYVRVLESIKEYEAKTKEFLKIEDYPKEQWLRMSEEWDQIQEELCHNIIEYVGEYDFSFDQDELKGYDIREIGSDDNLRQLLTEQLRLLRKIDCAEMIKQNEPKNFYLFVNKVTACAMNLDTIIFLLDFE